VKLTGAYRISIEPGFADTVPLARAVIAAAPDRVIWGSDYPHLSFADKVDSMQLFRLLGEWAPDQDVRKRILADNPHRCFGF
jgi:predicted TIM-barrel fold metal-dependent hydrolase